MSKPAQHTTAVRPTASARAATVQTADLQRAIVDFTRAFGLHRDDVTPCGAAMSVSQAHALTELERSAPMSQSDLGAVLKLTKSTVSRLVTQLEERGWVTRDRAQAEDGRVVQLSLTPSGARAADQVQRAREKRIGAMLVNLAEPDRAAVVRALELLAEAARV